MEITLKELDNEKDFELHSGDLLFNIERNEFFQLIRLENNKWMIYNLREHTYMSNSLYLTENNELMYSMAVKRINSRSCSKDKWKYLGRDDYEISILAHKRPR